ncbi:TIGR01548 family HAD-type hydrolase [Cyanobium sp. ATX 6A2]|uniref:TIGR01548 family HAD-type hydrolase n=1 Tax=Cyanobium sp. ATX 6A2 TaxID=2823700 RepID=UPI0037BFD466
MPRPLPHTPQSRAHQPPALALPLPESAPRAVLLFDIDGVVRDVAASYRRALAETVHHYGGWRPDATCIDALKGEGRWNNDWEASLELLRRHGLDPLPAFSALVTVFSGFYFGGDPDGEPAQWRGFIGDEALLIDRSCFESLSAAGIAWGFVSGAEPASARYVLEQRLGLSDPPLVAMGDAPDKPDPTGLMRLARMLGGEPGALAPPVAYLGDTVADVLTVQNARRLYPSQRFFSLAVAPPHLHHQPEARRRYERSLQSAGADAVITTSDAALGELEQLLATA